MSIINYYVDVKVYSKNVKSFKKKGYSCEIGDIVSVHIKELDKGSHKKVECKCNSCEKNLSREFRDLGCKNYHLCSSCNGAKIGKSRLNKNIIRKRFGKLIVKERKKKRGKVWVMGCQCDCGNSHEVLIYNLKNGHVKSCGCYKREINGPDHHSWKSSVDDKSRHKRRKHRSISKKLAYLCYKRDDFKCFICNSNQNLRAHHLFSWKHFPYLRYFLSNLKTLCHKCHCDYHSQTKKATLNDFELYINK